MPVKVPVVTFIPGILHCVLTCVRTSFRMTRVLGQRKNNLLNALQQHKNSRPQVIVMSGILSSFNCKTFTEQLHSKFKVLVQGQDPVMLELIEVSERNTPKTEAFSLMFS